jgi:hypothetical protein
MHSERVGLTAHPILYCEGCNLSKEKSPAFQFYPRDLLSDINWIMMNYPERGMYWQLISICWLEGSIPADLGAISRILQVDVCVVEDAWRVVGKCFKVGSPNGDRLIHPRLELERQKQAEWSKKSAIGGKRSAHKRKQYKQIIGEQGGIEMVPTKRQPKVNSSSSSSSSNNISVPTEQTVFKEFIFSEYIKERNCKLITDKTDWIHLNNLLKSCNGHITIEKLKDAWVSFLKSSDPFHQKQGHPLRWWCGNINAFLGERPSVGKSKEDTFWKSMEEKYG